LNPELAWKFRFAEAQALRGFLQRTARRPSLSRNREADQGVRTDVVANPMKKHRRQPPSAVNDKAYAKALFLAIGLFLSGGVIALIGNGYASFWLRLAGGCLIFSCVAVLLLESHRSGVVRTNRSVVERSKNPLLFRNTMAFAWLAWSGFFLVFILHMISVR
jgi:hypothetical protein